MISRKSDRRLALFRFNSRPKQNLLRCELYRYKAHSRGEPLKSRAHWVPILISDSAAEASPSWCTTCIFFSASLIAVDTLAPSCCSRLREAEVWRSLISLRRVSTEVWRRVARSLQTSSTLEMWLRSLALRRSCSEVLFSSAFVRPR